MTSPADGDGSQPPPAPHRTFGNEPLPRRRSKRRTRSKYKSQLSAIHPQQPPTSANTATTIKHPGTQACEHIQVSHKPNQPPSSSLQQPPPTLTNHDQLVAIEPSSPSIEPSLYHHQTEPSLHQHHMTW